MILAKQAAMGGLIPAPAPALLAGWGWEGSITPRRMYIFIYKYNIYVINVHTVYIFV